MTRYIVRLMLKRRKGYVVMLWLIALMLGCMLSVTSAMLIGQRQVESVFDFSTLKGAGLMQMSLDLNPLDAVELPSPQWMEAWEQVEQLDNLTAVWAQYPLYDRQLGEVLLARGEMMAQMPMPLSEGTWPIWEKNAEGAYPIILDFRLRGQYKIGDRIELALNSFPGKSVVHAAAFVAGFLRKDNGHVSLAAGRSELYELSTYVETYPDTLINLSVLPDEFVRNDYIYRGGCALLIPGPGQQHPDGAREWNRRLSENGVGEVLSMDKLYEEHTRTQRQWVPGFVAFTIMLALLLSIAMAGFVSVLLYQKRRSIAVLNMLGLDRKHWLRAMMVLQLGMMWPAILGGALARVVVLVYQTSSILPGILPAGIVLCVTVATQIGLRRSWHRIDPIQLFLEAK